MTIVEALLSHTTAQTVHLLLSLNFMFGLYRDNGKENGNNCIIGPGSYPLQLEDFLFGTSVERSPVHIRSC